MGPKGFKWVSKSVHNVPNWFILVHNGPNWFILVQIGPNWSKWVKIVPNKRLALITLGLYLIINCSNNFMSVIVSAKQFGVSLKHSAHIFYKKKYSSPSHNLLFNVNLRMSRDQMGFCSSLTKNLPNIILFPKLAT